MTMKKLLKLFESDQMTEKAVSKQQQKFMGMVHAMQKGEKVKGASSELKKAAQEMPKKAAKDFASTKHKGLPQKVTEDVMLDEGGNALRHITNRFKHEVKSFMNSGNMAENLYDALYDYYLDTGEMPYGIAKAREGDPYQWVEERFYADMGSDMSESAVTEELVADDTLSELARLAGLTTEGLGDDMAYGAGRAAGTVKRGFDAARRGAGEMADEFKRGMTNAQNPPSDAYPDEMQRGIKPKFSSPKQPDTRLPVQGQERGPGKRGVPGVPMGTMEPSMRNEPHPGLPSLMGDESDIELGVVPAYPKIPTLPSNDIEDPITNVDQRKRGIMTVDEAAELNQMRRIAGLNECGDMGMSQSDSFNVSTNMSSDGTRSVNISAQGDRADSLLQMLKMAGMRPHDDHEHMGMTEPEIIMVSSNPHDEMMDEERETEYANTPEEEYGNVETQFIGGDGEVAGMEKQMHRGGSARFSDNPLAVDEMLDEELDPKKKQRLKDLIDQYRDATDPEAYYGLNDEYPDSEEVIAQIRHEFGDRTADSVEQGSSMHYPRPGHSMGDDPMQYKSSPRITKSGVLNKQDVESMKRDIKQRLKQGVAEGSNDLLDEELSALLDSILVREADPRRPTGDTGIADIYTADKGQPPSPDEGPTAIKSKSTQAPKNIQPSKLPMMQPGAKR